MKKLLIAAAAFATIAAFTVPAMAATGCSATKAPAECGGSDDNGSVKHIENHKEGHNEGSSDHDSDHTTGGTHR